MTVAALYVQTGGCYFDLPDVDPWDEAQDARLYAGRIRLWRIRLAPGGVGTGAALR